eukprot:INCI15057.5.p1 GENE.INCI15057.5~~INCI15057.5.p1  ORF type:complete len:152 (-),score=23.35 INCI15057.5:105-560(-)
MEFSPQKDFVLPKTALTTTVGRMVCQVKLRVRFPDALDAAVVLQNAIDSNYLSLFLWRKLCCRVGDIEDPRVLRDLALYRKKCGEHAVTAGKHVVVATVDTVREAVEAGYSFIALGTELLHIMNGADSVVATAQRTLGSTPLEDGQSPGGF